MLAKRRSYMVIDVRVHQYTAHSRAFLAVRRQKVHVLTYINRPTNDKYNTAST